VNSVSVSSIAQPAPGSSEEHLEDIDVAIPGKSLRVVAIGGGTGLSTLLRGLRRHVSLPDWPTATPSEISDLAAVVTVTDDGGSSGRLRKDFNMLPPGDLRNCMVALSAEEDLLSKLFAYRFRAGNGLDGHNFGNLFVAALTDITGDFAHAVQLASKILATRGRIYPATTSNATLVARMDDGSEVRGETNITASRHRIAELMIEPPDAAAMPETLDAIRRADLITVGPGSLYTSLITNLLVQGIPTALAEAHGVRVFVCNLMTQANESLGLTASEHIERIYEHTRAPVFDYAIVNTASFSKETLSRYAAENASPIVADLRRIEALGVRCIAGDFASEESFVRHDADRVTDALLAVGRSAMTQP
jgi:uncharacterized cofD-like protein